MIKINKHWASGIKRVPSGKMNGEIVPKMIVMHYTCGWTTAGDVQTLAKDATPASAHLVLSREGEWTQIIPFNRRAWHAGPSKYREYTDINSHSIGIEISNIGWLKMVSPGRYADQYGHIIGGDGKFEGLNRKAHTPPKDWEVHPHPRLSSVAQYRWEPYYEPQLTALDAMVRLLKVEYPTIEYVVSHEEIDTRGWKQDPGPMFPMRRYQKVVEDRESSPVAPPKPVVKTAAPPSWWLWWK